MHLMRILHDHTEVWRVLLQVEKFSQNNWCVQERVFLALPRLAVQVQQLLPEPRILPLIGYRNTDMTNSNVQRSEGVLLFE
jgi:hypothetical protein